MDWSLPLFGSQFPNRACQEGLAVIVGWVGGGGGLGLTCLIFNFATGYASRGGSHIRIEGRGGH